MTQRTRKAFWTDERGATAALFALALPVLIVVGGVAFDYTRLAALDSEMQNIADQAALAGVTQLDGESGACSRAAAAAVNLVRNKTLLANDGAGIDADIVSSADLAAESACDATGVFRFWQRDTESNGAYKVDADGNPIFIAATSDANADFLEVVLGNRVANYAFTPIAGKFFDNVNAAAMAGLGSSVCKVPPLMICNPNPGSPFNAAGKIGWGIMVTGHGNVGTGPGTGNVSAWAPGSFGFLEVGSGQNADLIKALAYDTPGLNCVSTDKPYPETGNPQSLYRAINTRFDIYDFPDNNGGGNVLSACHTGSCPPASNVVKDLVKADSGTTAQKCGLGTNGWKLPNSDRQFWPKNISLTSSNLLQQYNDTGHSSSIDAMGLTRDLCHYASYGSACSFDSNHRIGDGIWARGDYFTKYHGGIYPAFPVNHSTLTRYQTYLWELGLLMDDTDPDNPVVVPGGTIPNNVAAGSNLQFGRQVCNRGTPSPARRVLTVAIVDNCASLTGGSNPVEIGEWVDMFLVQPSVDSRGNGDVNDAIYMEVIRPAEVGTGTELHGSQEVRRDVPYLVR